MEYVIIVAIVIFVLILISAICSKPKERLTEKEKAEKRAYWREKQGIPNTDIKDLDWDGFYEKCSKAEEEREKAGRTCQSIDFRIAGTQYRSDEAIERANGLELFELLYLEWEKDNPQDPYAIKILTDDGYHIGYMPAKYTKKFHSKINEYTECKVWDIKDQDYTDAPLIEVHAFFEWKKRIRKSSIKNNLEKGLE